MTSIKLFKIGGRLIHYDDITLPKVGEEMVCIDPTGPLKGTTKKRVIKSDTLFNHKRWKLVVPKPKK